ncbi:sugar kinase [Simiduia agarivorans]|uniref:2-dehydro-3-deoxygluconokinase n=1 Tax=Simiduia agarivorans (strain DSM 21679 / JCM 13881 / BCRC 17597 / SA1) TaxID=1117647 RepID=K4KI52_SIMAS|nr:sugar kinase [Simiduia agarivorans]AFU98814.1 2-keto-3-deoxygluconate kinase [Simiduia agarivorans SA1 = DSM 21679]
MPKIAALGECMIELAPTASGDFRLGFAGDTLNTAIYLARFGVEVDYLTALGDDHFSDAMLSQWQQEGIGTRRVERFAGRLPGLYLIETDVTGERSFHYWRNAAPARDLLARAPQVLDDLQRYDMLYLSGITLSLYEPEHRHMLFDKLAGFRAQGGRVAFDINYRPRNWSSREEAIACFSRMQTLTDIALPSLDDEQSLYGPLSADAVIDRYRDAGCNEVVVKQGKAGTRLCTEEVLRTIPVPELIQPLDTTAAGDSFNAGYLAARLVNRAPEEAVLAGSRCAACVIQFPGAIVPRAQFMERLGHA